MTLYSDFAPRMQDALLLSEMPSWRFGKLHESEMDKEGVDAEDEEEEASTPKILSETSGPLKKSVESETATPISV